MPTKTTKKPAVKNAEKKEGKQAVKKTAPRKKAVAEPVEIVKPAVAERYLYAVGRRKTAVARVRLYEAAQGKAEWVVNQRPARKYFGTVFLENMAFSPLKTAGLENKFRISVVVRGGGLHGQADAVKLGVARSLIKHDPLLRPILKASGFLTRDSRQVERKKPGLKKARRAPQWAKR